MVTSDNTLDLAALTRGDKAAWDAFVVRFSGVIRAAAHSILARSTNPTVELADLVQDVFVRLCRDDFRLLRSYDASRASISTWLAVVARSAALDVVRRKVVPTAPLDDAAETAEAEPMREPERLKVPPGLLSPRQELIMSLIYGRDMDPGEIGTALGIDAQTVRSMHHKALVRLRAHFRIDDDPVPGAAKTPTKTMTRHAGMK